MILNYISDNLENIDEYIEKTRREHFAEFNDVQTLNNIFNNIYDNISYQEVEYLKLSSYISNAINKISPLNSNIVTYRGVDLESFKRYGITSLEELLKLKGEYYYEPAFTSTSLIRKSSFFNKELKGINKCNIEIKYLIPQNSADGIALLDNETTYSKNEANIY